MRAYDLASGAAYSVGSCSQLALQSGGFVDRRATDSARSVQTSVGRRAPLALQEALWFLLVAPELRTHAQSFGMALPEGTRPVRYATAGGEGLLLEGLSACMGSGDTTLTWQYVLDGGVAASGELTWPGCGWDPRNQYAVQLLRVAEELLEPGCPGAPAPEVLSHILLELAPDGIDVDAMSARRASEQIAGAWKTIGRSLPDCAAAAPLGSRDK